MTMKYRNYEVNNKNPLMNIKLPKWLSSPWSCDWWYIKHSRNLSGCAGVLVFLIIMVIFFCSLNNKKHSLGDNNQQKKTILLKSNLLAHSSYCSQLKQNEIRCSSFDKAALTAVQEEINSIANETSSIITLEFVNLSGSMDIMAPNWLYLLEHKISSLKIEETLLPTINENTFQGAPFSKMENLQLILVGDLILNTGSFSGLHDLRDLIITGKEIIWASPETLLAISVTLTNLYLSDCISNPKVLQNLTGGEKTFQLKSLALLEIQQNDYSTLLANTFSKTPNLMSLYMDSSNLIDGLDVNVFVGINPAQLFLRYTKLTTLPKGIFDPFDTTVMYLTDNKWNCECSFQWFQKICESVYMFDCNGLKCFTHGEAYDMNTFPFCDSTTTDSSKITTFHPVTTIKTSTPKIETTTKNPITSPNYMEYDEEYCFPANRTIFEYVATSSPRVIYLGSQNIRVQFQQVGSEAKYVVTLDQNLEDDVVFFLSNTNGWSLCLTEMSNNFTLETLEYGQTYVICMLHASQHTVSPKNCQSLSVPQKWQDQIWISNHYKLHVLVGVATGVFVTILLSLFGSYVYVKKNPQMIYGKDNVIVIERDNSTVKKSTKDLNYEEQRYTPSLMSISDGYLTPRIYETAEDFDVKIPRMERSANQASSKVYPSVRVTKEHRADSEEDIYESVNVWLSSSSSHYSVPSSSHL